MEALDKAIKSNNLKYVMGHVNKPELAPVVVETALHYGNYNVAYTVATKWKKTILTDAVKDENMTVISYLINHGFVDEYIAAYTAAEYNQKDVINYLLKNHYKHDLYDSIFLGGIEGENPFMIRFANENDKDLNFGYGMLLAIDNNKFYSLDYLLQICNPGKDIFEIATIFRNPRAVQILLENGLIPTKKDLEKALSMYNEAEEDDIKIRKEIVDIFKDYGLIKMN